jgi:hypothetical protein
MLINVELPNGMTVKVESDWFYSLSDNELEKFYDNQTVNFEYHQIIKNPFDNSALETFKKDAEDEFEDLDISIDFIEEE